MILASPCQARRVRVEESRLGPLARGAPQESPASLTRDPPICTVSELDEVLAELFLFYSNVTVVDAANSRMLNCLHQASAIA